MSDARDVPPGNTLRDLPSVDHLLRQPAIANLLDEFDRAELIRCIRIVLDRRRDAILAGEQPDLDIRAVALDLHEELYRRRRRNLRRVINATGIVLHTGLGRAPLADEAIEAINDVAAGYSNLELDLETGRRGDRHENVRELLREQTGAEDALVVNNNAGATYLALNSLAAGRGVVISRGQLVEIGGSYRMPDIMAAARCNMIEVGATNRTHLADYERVIDEQTSVLLRVHTSNYRIQGFAASPSLQELVALARKYARQGLIVIDDLGSGLIDRPTMQAENPNLAMTSQRPPADTPEWDEPTVTESVAAGVDLTLFSGDKLLGGPQAGIVVGRSELIARLRKNPLMRTLRPDKLTLAALEATLRLYREPATLTRRLPVLRLLTASAKDLEELATALVDRIESQDLDVSVESFADESYAGGGSLPTIPFPTHVVSVRVRDVEPGLIASALRHRDLPIICRVQDDAVVFDCRTLSADDTEQIPPALAAVLSELHAES